MKTDYGRLLCVLLSKNDMLKAVFFLPSGNFLTDYLFLFSPISADWSGGPVHREKSRTWSAKYSLLKPCHVADRPADFKTQMCTVPSDPIISLLSPRRLLGSQCNFFHLVADNCQGSQWWRWCWSCSWWSPSASPPSSSVPTLSPRRWRPGWWKPSTAKSRALLARSTIIHWKHLVLFHCSCIILHFYQTFSLKLSFCAYEWIQYQCWLKWLRRCLSSRVLLAKRPRNCQRVKQKPSDIETYFFNNKNTPIFYSQG